MSERGRSLRPRKQLAPTSASDSARNHHQHQTTPTTSRHGSEGTSSDRDESRDSRVKSRDPRVKSRDPRVRSRESRVQNENKSANFDETLVASKCTTETVIRDTNERNRDRVSHRDVELNSRRDKNHDDQLSRLLTELEVCKAKLELAQKEAETAKCKLEIAQIKARSVSGGAASDDIAVDDRVRSWVEQHSKRKMAVEDSKCPPRHDKPRVRSTPHALEGQQNYAPMLQRSAPELPHFDGNITEWIAFHAEFMDSAPMFSPVNNVSRIRRALKGEARTAVKSIMYTVQDPYEIMDALERHFGDPEEIVLTEIHNVKRMPRLAEDNSNIVSFASHVANAVATIKSLRQDKYLHAPELVNKIIDKLNILVRYEWSKYKQLNADLPDLVAISSFLNDISYAAKRTTRSKLIKPRNAVNAVYYDQSPARQPSARPRPPPYQRGRSSSDSDSDFDDRSSHNETRPHTVAQVKSRDFKRPNNFRSQPSPPSPARESTRTKCAICEGANEHKVSACSKFLEAGIADRWDMAKSARICFRCLGASHRRTAKCKYAPCGVNQCEAGHHKLLHGLSAATVAATTGVNAGSVNTISRANTFLKIIPVEVTGPSGTFRTHALLDDGSSMTLIERETADRVAPRAAGEPLAIEGIGGHVVHDTESCRLKLNIRGLCSRNTESINAYTIDKLSIAPQKVSREIVEQCEHLSEILDELCYERATPTILIGQDNWHLIISLQVLCGKKSLPAASLTKLGWVLHGQYLTPRPALGLVNHVRPQTTEDEVLTLMKKHFDIESLGVESKLPRDDPDKRALSLLDATCIKIPGENRYQAGLLWRSDNEELPDNRTHALRRLYSLERKLDKDSNLKAEYAKHVNNLLEKGYAEKVVSRPPVNAPRTWYLPHFPTIHPQKGKIRLVFDAAATAYGKSLNSALLTGPDLLESLFGVLVRFREGRTAVIADVKEMFLQVEIVERDRDSLRFVWREGDRESPPQEYRMKRLIFGSASSPTTALYVKNKNANCHANELPAAAEKTIKNAYMDDILMATDENNENARRLVNEIYDLNMRASFELRGFASNNPIVISDVTKSENETSPIGRNESERTLGLKWNHKRDTIGFNVNLRNTPEETLTGNKLPTKRQVTSSAMSIFDPIGYASPISVLGKALMQEVWRTGIGWDTVIPDSLAPAWRSFIENIQQLKNLEIPRYVPARNREASIHVFCDASEKIYACAIYLVSTHMDGHTTAHLVAAKARVAPLKIISIPRLELQSCVLGTRLAESVIKESEYTINNKYYWSDSRTVLAWIRADPRTYKSFVAHRLAEIENSTTPADWNWVPSALNVADDATKGVPDKFGTNHRWFLGPEFIKQNKENWPTEKPTEPVTPSGEERVNFVGSVQTANNKFNYLPEVNRFSKYERLIRATARVMVAAEVWKAKSLHRKHDKEMNNEHIKLAIILLIRRSQNVSYPEEIKHLEAGRALPKKSLLYKIAVKVAKGGVIVLDTRTDRDKEYIPVLHAKEDFTRMLIHHFHEKFNHGNHATVINELKQRYFIIGLRGNIRYITNKCQWCRTYKGATLKAPVGDLPAERLLANQPPFTATAVDLFGPMNITIGRRHEKRWGVLYTCLTTRAIHLELAASLSASSMILSLRRMMARRGTPTVIYSDNATNFYGAERELSEAVNSLPDSLKQFTSDKRITWKKIPPGNPSAGGAWERLVGSVKTALKVTLKDRAPHEEVLHTLLLEAEHIVNSRPLTPVNPDLEAEALTPNHFLLGRSNAMSPLGSFADTTLSPSSWKTTQALADHFWTRWLKEYRPNLLPRSSAHATAKKLQQGDVVIIADNTMPRGTWPRGIIARLYPGPDGHIRVTDVQTRAGIVRRPASRLIFICSTTEDGADARGGDCRI